MADDSSSVVNSMADESTNVALGFGTAVGGITIALFTGASSWLAVKAYRDGRLSRGWWRLRVWAIDGVTTLEHALTYGCAMCGHSLDQREEVRTLSCGHVCHHLPKGAKCGSNIDDWLRENRMHCPACCRIAYPVVPWKAPPASAPPPAPTPSPSSAQSPRTSASDLEAQDPQQSAVEMEQGPQQQAPQPPSSPWFQDTLLFGSPSTSPSPSQ